MANNVLNKTSDFKKDMQKKIDDLSTKAYKFYRTTNEKYKSIMDGSNKNKEEKNKEKDFRKRTDNDFDSMGYKENEFAGEYNVDKDGIALDSARTNFSVIDKDEYVAPIQHLSAVEIIEDFLKSEDKDIVFEEGDKKGKEPKKYDEARINQAKAFETEFKDHEGFGFNALTKELQDALKLQDGSGRTYPQSKESRFRYEQLNVIIEAFGGDKESLDRLGQDFNNALSERFCKTISDYLKGDINKETACNNLFMGVHGINSEEVPKDMSRQKMVNLCAMSNLGMEPSLYYDINNTEISSINDVIKSGDNINVSETITKNSLANIFEKTRKEGDQIKDIETSQNGGAGKTLLFENAENGNVDVFLDTMGDTSLIATQKDNGEFTKDGMEKALIQTFMSDKTVNAELEGRGENTLQKDIEKATIESRRDGLEHKMSDFELAAYNKEVEAALENHQKLVNQYSNQ